MTDHAREAAERIKHGPFYVMAGAPWNVLDSRGARIALCGGDSSADWEKFGPPIAKAVAVALNDQTPCPGCGLKEMHKACPAHGTEAYMNPEHEAWGSVHGIVGLKIAAATAELRAELEQVTMLLSEAPRTNTMLPPEFQKLWESLVDLSDKAAFKNVVRHLERVEAALAEAQARADSLRRTLEVFRHTHAASSDNPDCCLLCGMNIRDEVHLRSGESGDYRQRLLKAAQAAAGGARE